jgi:putative redox protein
MQAIELTREQVEYGFVATDVNGHRVQIDTSPETGGKNYGARPMQLLLMGLAGCSAIDVVKILNKQRQNVTDYKMVVRGEREHGKEPSLWKEIEVEFHIYGDVEPAKAQRAADLSIEKYCSVAATLRAAGAHIKYKVLVNDRAAVQTA